MKTKRVLVTGEAGSIGSNLVEERAGDVYRMHEGTAHREFREIDLRRVKERMRTPVVIDGRRVFEADGVRGLGFTYRGVGAGNYIHSLFLQSCAPN